MRSALGRRHLLAAIGAAGALVAAEAWAPARAAVRDPAVGRLVGLFKHRDSARAVGAAYLALHPEEANADALVRLIGDAPEDPVVIHEASPPELRAWLRRRQTHDFANGHIVKLDGWLLSRTEGRLCALSALT
jgi:hypothetical protein